MKWIRKETAIKIAVPIFMLIPVLFSESKMSYFKHQQNYQLCIYSKSCCECFFVQLEIQVLPTQLEVRILKIRLVNPYAQTNCRCDNFCALGCQRILECEWGCLSNLSHVHYTFFYHKIFSKFCKKKEMEVFFLKKKLQMQALVWIQAPNTIKIRGCCGKSVHINSLCSIQTVFFLKV